MQVKISQLFGVPAPDTAVIDIPDDIVGPVPEIKHHFFDPFVLRMLQLWISPRAPRNNMLIIGNGGVGKTAAFLQFAARMRIPVWGRSVSGKTRYDHLVGSLQMVNGNTIWVDGSLLAPYRNGGMFLANEVTRMDTGEQMRLVDALDSQSRITIDETGEVVERHPNFRFAATGNSGGFGDESGAYAGEKVASAAFLDRFMTLEMKPLSEQDEIALVQKVAPQTTDDIVKGMVTLARTVRDSFVGNGGALAFSISPRALCDWACLASEMRTMKGVDALRDSLNVMVLNGKPAESVKVVAELYEQWIPGSPV